MFYFSTSAAHDSLQVLSFKRSYAQQYPLYAEYNTANPSAKNSIVPIAPGFTTNI